MPSSPPGSVASGRFHYSARQRHAAAASRHDSATHGGRQRAEIGHATATARFGEFFEHGAASALGDASAPEDAEKAGRRCHQGRAVQPTPWESGPVAERADSCGWKRRRLLPWVSRVSRCFWWPKCSATTCRGFWQGLRSIPVQIEGRPRGGVVSPLGGVGAGDFQSSGEGRVIATAACATARFSWSDGIVAARPGGLGLRRCGSRQRQHGGEEPGFARG